MLGLDCRHRGPKWTLVTAELQVWAQRVLSSPGHSEGAQQMGGWGRGWGALSLSSRCLHPKAREGMCMMGCQGPAGGSLRGECVTVRVCPLHGVSCPALEAGRRGHIQPLQAQEQPDQAGLEDLVGCGHGPRPLLCNPTPLLSPPTLPPTLRLRSQDQHLTPPHGARGRCRAIGRRAMSVLVTTAGR